MTTPHGGPPTPPTTFLDSGHSDYRAACPGFKLPPNAKGQSLSEAHHLVCVKTISERRVTDYPQDTPTNNYVDACLMLSGWDINDSVNLLGMPTNLQCSLGAGMNPANIPSHQVDHNNTDGYRKMDLRIYMKANVWNTVTANVNPPHNEDVQKLKTALEDASKEMDRRLKAHGFRGGAYKGTALNWAHRLELACRPTWYMPFSMAIDPEPREPPASKVPLESIFKKLK